MINVKIREFLKNHDFLASLTFALGIFLSATGAIWIISGLWCVGILSGVVGIWMATVAESSRPRYHCYVCGKYTGYIYAMCDEHKL